MATGSHPVFATKGTLPASNGLAARLAIRSGSWTGHTSGTAPNYVQGNLVILPASAASDFLQFCERNPKPCPLLGVSEPGNPNIPKLGANLDIRTDIPRYRVWRHGELVEERTDINDLWRDDLVAFVLGCSFSFEQPLIDAGIPLRHVIQGKNVAMFKTSIPCAPAGAFRGNMVVTMRPMSPADAIRAVLITAKLPQVHGAPVHLGDPAQIGIEDLGEPDFGDAVEVLPGEMPVYWACGVTPQAVVLASRPELCITHSPGSMLVTDVKESDLADLYRL
ncbi:hypothetical protein HDU93_005476 [Gonapodya sp. JEL0774]|nr:hypothetical protein HDU93_005476 [Gonapodya sp. JEL0774]